jgi:hypothetical protein
MKTAAGTAGWTRVKKSRKRFWNIGGDAESFAERPCDMSRHLSAAAKPANIR